MTTTPPEQREALLAGIAQAVRAEMARRGARQADIAETLGITQASLSRKLKRDGSGVPFTVVELCALAHLFQVDLAALIDCAPQQRAS